MQHEGEWGRHLWWTSFTLVWVSILGGIWLTCRLLIAIGLVWLLKQVWLLSFWKPTWWSSLILTSATGGSYRCHFLAEWQAILLHVPLLVLQVAGSAKLSSSLCNQLL